MKNTARINERRGLYTPVVDETINHCLDRLLYCYSVDAYTLTDQVDQAALDLSHDSSIGQTLNAKNYNDANTLLLDTLAEFIDLYTRREQYNGKMDILSIYSGYDQMTYNYNAKQFYANIIDDYEEIVETGGGYDMVIDELRPAGYEDDLAEADLCYSGLVLLSNVIELAHFATNLVPGLAGKLREKLDENNGEIRTALFGVNLKTMMNACCQLAEIILEQANTLDKEPYIERASNITEWINGLINVFQEHLSYFEELPVLTLDESVLQ
ncbi:hypothetical protein FWC31_00790 [Candidatus Saccharibacteria bacterium]|nr:hypothetical protein [Candidatus Saccharibacteria bacterium]